MLQYLNTSLPMAFWSITRVEKDRQTYLYLDDRSPREDLTQFGPTLNVLSELLTIALASDRAVNAAEHASWQPSPARPRIL